MDNASKNPCAPAETAEDGSLHWLQRCDGMSERMHVWRWVDRGGDEEERFFWEYHGTADRFLPDSEYMQKTWRYVGPARPDVGRDEKDARELDALIERLSALARVWRERGSPKQALGVERAIDEVRAFFFDADRARAEDKEAGG